MTSSDTAPTRRRPVCSTERLADPRAGARCPRWAAAFALALALQPVRAQQALRNSLAGQAAEEALRLHPDSMPYTYKSGDFKLLIAPSVELDWNDNVNTSKEKVEQDVILRPVLGLSVSYPLTERNLLLVSLGVGYQDYFEHKDLSTWYVQSGSGLSFDVFVKDFLINFHDRLSYSRDASTEAAVAGTSQFGNVNNSAGLRGTWDLEDLTLSLGYDHATLYSPAVQFQSQDSASEFFSSQAGLKLNPRLTAGLEATASMTAYDQQILNDNSSYSAGVFADWRPGSYFRLQPRAGYTISQFQQTSQSIQTADLTSWYADVTLSHAMTAALSYSLSAGHEVRSGVGSDTIEDWYARPTFEWKIFKLLALRTFFTYEHGNTGVGNVRGNLMETYDYAAAGLTLSHDFTARLSLALNFRLTVRTSTILINEYEQNLVGLQLTYSVK